MHYDVIVVGLPAVDRDSYITDLANEDESQRKYLNVIVVGGGHAGSEAALAAARMGARTLLLTHSIDTLGQMSCNPAIGGIGKGHLVREVDALGGMMALAADHCGIQFRTLNSRKGPAVRATRAQIDRALDRVHARRVLESTANLEIFQQAVADLVFDGERVAGVLTEGGLRVDATAVIITAGTFLAGRIHVGESAYAAGRAGDPPSTVLAARLRERPLRVARLKTGTPPRIDARSVDFSSLAEQPGDDPVPVFSFMGDAALHPRQVVCHVTHTNERTHDIIRGALSRSPLYSGRIEGIGPRYCPSVEDKVVRFPERTAHQIFIEPEGLDSRELYPNGISTSLPFETQLEMVRSIAGLERAHLTRPGYAIEYDFFDPRDLRPWLESRHLPGLWLAGQVNGTTGYEEAAAQGILAGINAALRIRGDEPWWPRRDEAYIGVLTDDLVTRGVDEPYRMFTSRAEHRLLLREDNADLRLTPVARELGLVEEARWRRFHERREAIEREHARLQSTWLRPAETDAPAAERVLGAPFVREQTLAALLERPEVRYRELVALHGHEPGVDDESVALQVEVRAKYRGYIERQQRDVERMSGDERARLPDDLDYASVRGLSAEVSQKLAAQRPATLALAGRIPGVTPAALSLLRVHLRRRQAEPIEGEEPAGASQRREA